MFSTQQLLLFKLRKMPPFLPQSLSPIEVMENNLVSACESKLLRHFKLTAATKIV